MKQRFPSVQTILNGLPEYSDSTRQYAAQAGAFRGIYDIAIREYHSLRGLATAALSGQPENIKALADFLKMQEEIANLYDKERIEDEKRSKP